APYAGQPRLLIARQTGRTVVVLKLIETGVAHQRPPALEIVVDAITAAVPSLLILSTRVRTEQHATRLERAVQIAQHTRQFLQRNMEQHRVGKNAVEMGWGQA